MPGFRKPPADLVDRFRTAVAGIEGAELKQMFGMPAAFINGNMAAGVFEDSIMVRLSEPDRAARLAEGWSLFEPMGGRPMREYVGVPPALLGDAEAIRGLIEQAAIFVRTMPPKAPKPRKSQSGR